MNKRRSSNLRQSLGMPLVIGGSFGLDQEAKSGQEQKKRLTYTTNGSSLGSRPRSSYQSSARQTQMGAGRQSQAGVGRLTQAGMGRQSQTLYKGPSRTSTGRVSTGRSSMYGTSSQMKKDPRNLSDRSFQMRTIKTLLKFLTENNFPKSMTVKGLQSPTCRDFLHIFNFLLEHLDDSLHVDGMNIVEEVPGVLKLLGYPFNISKNHLLNVGSPHSWPILLGAIAWLLDACAVPSNTDQIFFCRSDNFDDIDDKKFKDDYEEEERAYAGYAMHGEASEQYQEIRENRIAMLSSECEETEADNSRLRQENGGLSEAIQDLSKSSLPVLQSQLDQNDKAIYELDNHMNNELLPAIKLAEDEKVAIDRKCSEIETQIESTRLKGKELEEQIRMQPMSTAEAQELHQSIRDAENLLRTKRTQQDQSMQRISELQMRHNKSVSEIDEQCQVINHKMHRLSALLPDVASLTPLDYDNSKRADPDILQQLVIHAKRLRDDVQKLHENVTTSTLEYEGKIRSAESTQSILHTEILRENLEVDNLEQTLDKARDNLARRRKLNEEAMKTEMAERQLLENQLLTLQQQQQLYDESQAEKEYLAVCSRSQSEMIDMNEQLRVKKDELKQLLANLTEFVESVRKTEDHVVEEVDALAKEFREHHIHLPPAKYLAPFKHQQ